MSGHRPWAEIRHKGTPEEEAETAAETREILRENALDKLRQRHHVTQRELTAALEGSQAHGSRIEGEDEPQLATMHRFIEALGGELIVQARIGDEVIDLLAGD